MASKQDQKPPGRKEVGASGFDALMSQMGVKPLHQAPKNGGAARAGRAPAPPPAPSARPAPPPVVAPPPPVVAPPPPVVAPPVPVPETVPWPDPEAPPQAGLMAQLHTAGLRGPTELDGFLRAVADARLSMDLLRLLGALDPAMLDRFLGARLVLLGDCASCPRPTGVAVLRVPAARCGVCRGLDSTTVRRRLVDACLVGGFPRVALVGGRAVDLRFIVDLLGDARVELLLLPTGSVAGPAELASLARANAIVFITGAGSPPALDLAELPCPRVEVVTDAPVLLADRIAAALRELAG